MVHLQRLYEKYEDDGLLAFAIAMAPERDVAERLTRELDITFPIFWGTGSELGEQYAFG